MNSNEKVRLEMGCVFANGYLSVTEEIKSLVHACDLIIAANGGLRHIVSLNLKPHVLIGDRDSLDTQFWNNDPDIEQLV